MKRITHEDGVTYFFSAGIPPAAEVDLGESFVVETLDALHGKVFASEGRISDLDLDETNPATGPIRIEGVSAGDCIGVEVLGIEIGKVGIGLSLTQFRQIPIRNGSIIFGSGITLTPRPHIGVIGVSPSEGSFSCKVPGEHGGNLDTVEIRAGSMVILPAQVDGAMLALGDIHAVMADGEVNGAGLEVPATVTLRVRRVKGPLTNGVHVITQDSIVILASAPAFENAAKMAVSRCARLLEQTLHLSEPDAMLLTGYCGELRVSQLVNPLVTAKVVFPRHFLESDVARRYFS